MRLEVISIDSCGASRGRPVCVRGGIHLWYLVGSKPRFFYSEKCGPSRPPFLSAPAPFGTRCAPHARPVQPRRLQRCSELHVHSVQSMGGYRSSICAARAQNRRYEVSCAPAPFCALGGRRSLSVLLRSNYLFRCLNFDAAAAGFLG